MLRYVEVLLRYKLRFALLLVVMPATIAAASVAFFPTYRAGASLWADTPSYFGSSFVPADWNQYLSPAQNEADSLSQVIQTRAFSDLLLKHLQADGFVTDDAMKKRYLAYLGAGFKITTAGTHLVVLSATCDRPAECVALLQETVATAKEESATLQKEQAKQGIAFLEAELKGAQSSLNSSEAALQKYLAEHPGVKVDTSATGPPELNQLLSDVQDQRTRVNQIQTNLGQAEYYSSASASLLDTGPRVIDQPHITKGGLVGDGTSLKRGLIAWAVFGAIGGAYLWLLVWVDKTARDPGELERRFKIPVVTVIPVLNPVERL